MQSTMASNQIDIQFTADAIDVSLANVLPAIGCGGECVFVGRTRPQNNEQHGELIALLYDCYEEMAMKELQAMAQEAIDRFGVRYVRVTHSKGRVSIDDASVVIAVASQHRDDAFTACRFMIDVLKKRVPIWKQELWADGTTWSDGMQLETL